MGELVEKSTEPRKYHLYQWTPYDPKMTRKIEKFKIQNLKRKKQKFSEPKIFRTKNSPPSMPHLSELKISLLECLISLLECLFSP